ncbi:MAG: cache domain-containing protein, partial [Nautiliaceae bacterium]
MRRVEAFKERILKLNSLSIFLIIILYSIISFGIVYFILNSSLQRDIEFTKKEYFNTKKTIVKNQVLNLVNQINQVFDRKHQYFEKKLHKNVEYLASLLLNKPESHYSSVILKFKKLDPRFDYFVLDSDLDLIYTTRKHSSLYDKEEIKKIINNLKSNDSLTIKTYNDRYFISGKEFVSNGKKYWIFSLVSSKVVHNAIKDAVKEMLYSVKFNKNKGYLSIIEIKKINGGKKYGKFVAIPIKPEWEGVYLNDNKKDAKGIEYRKEYLKLLREKGEGYFTYWFKGKDGELYRKISYIKLYKPFNWAIVGGIYINELNNLVHEKEEKIKKELSKIFKYYLLISAIFLIIVYFVTKYENKMLETIIDNYEKKIQRQNEQLKRLNQNLQKEVEKKTKELLESYFIDPLTKLPNREKLLSDKDEDSYIALMNIDSFKEINDFYGIEAGDEVLIKISEILKKIDLPYKLAGDEFAFLDKDLESLKEKVNKVFEMFESNKLIL